MMDISFEKFNFYIEKGQCLPELDDLVAEEKIDSYLEGNLIQLSDEELEKIKNFKSSDWYHAVLTEMYMDVTREIALNVALIPSQDQLGRYLNYLKDQVDTLLFVLGDITQMEYIKSNTVIKFWESIETERKGIYTRIHKDPVSRLLDDVEFFINQYEQIQDYIIEVAKDNGVLPTLSSSSNLVFKGLPSDFIELVAALYEHGSIQRVDGKPLKRVEIQKSLRKFLNIEHVAGFDDHNLSKRLSERKSALKASFLVQLKKSFERYSEK